MMYVDPAMFMERSEAEAFNREAVELLSSTLDGETALRSVLAFNGFTRVDTTDPNNTDGGYVELHRLNGRYLIVWFSSQFGHAFEVTSADEFENAHIGFDDQHLHWGEPPVFFGESI
jgi:hypothetical protein